MVVLGQGIKDEVCSAVTTLGRKIMTIAEFEEIVRVPCAVCAPPLSSFAAMQGSWRGIERYGGLVRGNLPP